MYCARFFGKNRIRKARYAVLHKLYMRFTPLRFCIARCSFRIITEQNEQDKTARESPALKKGGKCGEKSTCCSLFGYDDGCAVCRLLEWQGWLFGGFRSVFQDLERELCIIRYWFRRKLGSCIRPGVRCVGHCFRNRVRCVGRCFRRRVRCGVDRIGRGIRYKITGCRQRGVQPQERTVLYEKDACWNPKRRALPGDVCGLYAVPGR